MRDLQTQPSTSTRDRVKNHFDAQSLAIKTKKAPALAVEITTEEDSEKLIITSATRKDTLLKSAKIPAKSILRKQLGASDATKLKGEIAAER